MMKLTIGGGDGLKWLALRWGYKDSFGNVLPSIAERKSI